MIRPLHVLARKFRTFCLTVASCSNWLAIALGKMGLTDGPAILHFRDGFRLKVSRPLRRTWGEIFEPAIADVYQIGTVSPELIVDVGANIGAFGCRAGFLHPNATVHAFEPSLPQVNLLQENIRLNNLDKIILHSEAVTMDARQVVFSHQSGGGSSGIFLSSDDSETLSSTTLACIDYSGFDSIFLKLDCEGAEGEITEWVCDNLLMLPRQISIAGEYHHWCPVTLDQILENLRIHGFTAEATVLFDESYFFAKHSKIRSE